MKLLVLSSLALFLIGILMSCNKQDDKAGLPKLEPPINERLADFAKVEIKADLSNLSERDIQVLKILARAGKFADAIFWKQTSHDALTTRDSLRKLNRRELVGYLNYLMIQYGPYDRIHDNQRFIGSGPERKPKGANLYPLDLTKEEFENYIKAHPEQKHDLESQYTVVVRDGKNLKAIPYYKAYPETEEIAKLLEEAASYCDNQSLKNYLLLRAKAIRTDDYYESDMAWMDIKDSDIDIVIGPIENYEDELFNYKTAYECVLMVKDKEATKELEMYQQLLNDFEHKLPYDKKYIRKSAGKGNILQIVNVAYFGGDCQAGVKTIASSLPNDPRVTDVKGGKKSMFKNMMEAKFDKIVLPIAKVVLSKEDYDFVDKKAFTSFVTLHEVSHTLGRGYVYGDTNLSVRKALKEKYSAIEECKADVLGMYNHKHLFDMKKITADYYKKSMVTYLAGLFRSIRFGIEEAHGKSNMIQLNYLLEKGAIVKTGKRYSVNESIFMSKIQELARIILTIQAEGNYEEAGKFIEKYGNMSDELKKTFASMRGVPRDLNTVYDF